MSVLNTILTDLREKRLWPVALALLAALVAVPVLLSGKSSSSGPSSPAPSATAPKATALPAVSVKSGPGDVRLSGHGRDPFPQTSTTGASAGGSAGSPSPSPSGGSAGSGGTSGQQGGSGGAGTSTTPSSGSSGTTSSGSTTTTPTTTTTPNTNPSPGPSHAGLTDTESYDAALGITNAFGGFDTTDPVRLSALPSDRQPLLVELGVLKGGHRVLFVVQPGALLAGPGTCIPAPGDCQILSLAPNQTETLSMRTAAGDPDEVAQLAVTAIRVERHGSAAAAAKARRATSAFGRSLVGKSTSMFLPLFQYQPSLGAVVDRRSLTVEGS
jgi:hypothetical protein